MDSPTGSGWGLLIYNPASGTAAKFPPGPLLDVLREGGGDVRLHEFADGDVPSEIVDSALAAGATWIAVAGGDGTVEAVAAELVDSDIPLGVIPCGTYNNFALSAEIPSDPLEAARLIARGLTRKVDTGFVGDRPFFECVGVGLDAALFPLGEEIKSGAVAKTPEFFRRAASYPFHRFEVELDRPFADALVTQAVTPAGRRLEHIFRRLARKRIRIRALMITVSNGPHYGMNFTAAPDARIDDGQLTVTIFKRYSRLRLWWHYLAIRFSSKAAMPPRLLVFRAQSVTISHRRRVHAHADGQEISTWPVSVSIKPSSLRIFGTAKGGISGPPPRAK